MCLTWHPFWCFHLPLSCCFSFSAFSIASLLVPSPNIDLRLTSRACRCFLAAYLRTPATVLCSHLLAPPRLTIWRPLTTPSPTTSESDHLSLIVNDIATTSLSHRNPRTPAQTPSSFFAEKSHHPCATPCEPFPPKETPRLQIFIPPVSGSSLYPEPGPLQLRTSDRAVTNTCDSWRFGHSDTAIQALHRVCPGRQVSSVLTSYCRLSSVGRIAKLVSPYKQFAAHLLDTPSPSRP